MSPVPQFSGGPALPPSLALSPSAFLAARPHIHRLMTSCVVFRRAPSRPASSSPQHQQQHQQHQQQHQPPPPPAQGSPWQTLLLRRAASDSYALKWETPGGSVSRTRDASVLASAARELLEETALHVARVLGPVGMLPAPHPPAPPGLGVAPEDERAADDDGDDARTVTFLESGRRWGKVTLLVDVAEDLSLAADRGVLGDEGVVRTAADEHGEWAWVTEDEVRAGRDRGGSAMEYTSEGVWRTLLEAFRLRREMDADAGME